MSEEEIIEILENIIKTGLAGQWDYSAIEIAIKGLLDLYKREKSNNEELMQEYHKRVQEKLDLIYGNNILNKAEVEECYISKDKIRELIKDNSFEVYTKEYGNIDVIDLDSLNELLEGKNE